MGVNLDYLRGKKIGIVGMGITGRSVFKAVLPYAASVIWYDDNTEHLDIFSDTYQGVESKQWYDLDFMVLSPGCPTTYPKPHPLYVIAERCEVPICSDIDLLYLAQTDKQFVAVTGTNGKSTTVSLLHHILTENNADFALGGNVGLPVLSLDRGYTGYVLELSSFQLNITHSLHPNIAVILNITPDHLDRHGGMEEYIQSKCKIYERCKADDALVINIDNQYTRAIYMKLRASSDITLLPFSTCLIENGILSVIDNILYDNLFTHTQYTIDRGTSLQGQHNAENIAASIICAQRLAYNMQSVLSTFTSYKSLPHRMQYLGKKGNIKFYNDSKATNAESTASALKTFTNIYWIAGGISKSGGIEELVHYFANITHGFFFGSSKEQFANTARQNKLRCAEYDSMEEALQQAFAQASCDEKESIILLSPACSSFDQFKNFMHRGEVFTENVKKYIEC